jgi:hypothetical protein
VQHRQKRSASDLDHGKSGGQGRPQAGGANP